MKQKIAGLAILANVFLAIGKIIAGLISGSGAVFAEGLHSGVDILSSGISFVGIKISKRPVDEKHPYGHYKAEVLAGLLITAILFLTGAFIIGETIQEFKNPSPVKIGYLSLGIMLVSTVVNEIMARLKIHFGKKENSMSLLSDGVHSRVDVYSSLAVFIGLIFTKYWIYADSIFALLVGAYIIKESFSIGREAIDSLLDVSADDKIEEDIKNIVSEKKVELSFLKTQKKGSAITAELAIKLPSELNIEKATSISQELQKELLQQINNLEYVSIQISSHEMQTNFYKPEFGRSFSWQRKGKFTDKIKEATGKGPEGYCICEKCGRKIWHQRGVPCSQLECPKCKIKLIRKD